MLDIQRNIDGQKWLINPPRKSFGLADAKADILSEFKSSRVNVVCPYVDGDTVHSSFGVSSGSDTKLWDFALKYRLEHGVNESVVYIESQSDREGIEDLFLVVVIDDGEIISDNLCTSDDVYNEITSFVEIDKTFTFELFGVDTGFIDYIGFNSEELSVKKLPKALTETYLLKDECLFVKYDSIQERLKPKGILIRFLIPLIIIAGSIFYTLYEPPKDMSMEVVEEVVDEYYDYKDHMLNKLPQASNRLAQDFNNHIIFQETARGWEVGRVMHTNESTLIYEMRNDFGSLRELRSIVDIVSQNTTVPAVLDLSETGNLVVFAGQNTSIYTQNTVKIWNVREAYELLSDAITLLIPNCEINFTGFQSRDKNKTWKSMNISLDFQQMPIAQLMVLSKITKGLPVSIVNGSYVQTDGLLTGNVQIQVHGDDQ